MTWEILRGTQPFVHSVILGAILTVLSWVVNTRAGSSETREARRADAVVSTSSVLFICVGMTAVMLLVNDNIARAFAIGAAMAFLRFRVKMQGKFQGVALFYGAIVGMACGVGRAGIAWTVTLLFGGMLLAVLGVRAWVKNREASRLLDESDETGNVSAKLPGYQRSEAGMRAPPSA